MEFTKVRESLFALMAEHPSMRWDVVNGTIVVRIPVEEETANLFGQAKHLFG